MVVGINQSRKDQVAGKVQVRTGASFLMDAAAPDMKVKAFCRRGIASYPGAG
jgi:hypothetical protein